MSARAFDPAWLDRSALLLVDMNRSHLDHSIGHLLVAKPDADRIIARDIPGSQAMLEAHLRSTLNFVYPPGSES